MLTFAIQETLDTQPWEVHERKCINVEDSGCDKKDDVEEEVVLARNFK